MAYGGDYNSNWGIYKCLIELYVNLAAFRFIVISCRIHALNAGGKNLRFRLPRIIKTRRECPVCGGKMEIVDDRKTVKFYECLYCNYIEDV
jgi:hypothetical protein